ncbi:MAG TPA: adenine deaminase [Chitinophagaceae bacterium]|nr:adenine deaminase [Chitinophagaceae bacterium]
MTSVTANFVDIFHRNIFTARVEFDTKIRAVYLLSVDNDPALPYILPGFVDAHIHIESSMLIPSQFARLAVVHGTVATVSDPHEIANVCGLEGVRFMIANGKTVPFKFNFGAPSCVPATQFETAGAILDSQDVKKLLEDPEIRYLSEMMNFPGALQGDPEVMKKIAAARELGKPVDGHAPGLRGADAKNYIERGISTDHECFTFEEAEEKLKYGMKIIIREGSAARNFEALIPLLNDHPDMMMFGSDDKHPDELVLSHINSICARAVAKGIDIFNILQAACVNPVLHYKLDVGLLREDDPADFILVEDLSSFNVLETWIDGKKVAENGGSLINNIPLADGNINVFNCAERSITDFQLDAKEHYDFPIIEALDGQLITNKIFEQPLRENGFFVADPSRDILKLVVVNRYRDEAPAIAFIKNIGIKQGAIASSVAHDSHNIVAVGSDDESIMKAVNLVIRHKGGVSIARDNFEMVLPLPVAGLMSDADGYSVAELYAILDKAAKEAGSTLRSPYMTLSFMALLVIPHLKLSDLGLFDGDLFKIVR